MNVISLTGKKSHDADCVLTAAVDIGLEDVVVVGFTRDGGKLYVAHSDNRVPNVAFLLDLAKKAIVDSVA